MVRNVNLSAANCTAALHEMIRIRKEFQLAEQMIIESKDARCLRSFCDSGFSAAYRHLCSTLISLQKQNWSVSPIPSGMHWKRTRFLRFPVTIFNTPSWRKFFPGYPILTRVDNTSISLVSYVFMKQLEHDNAIKADFIGCQGLIKSGNILPYPG